MRSRTLDGSVVVVVGASSGIGRATALGFARHHAALVLAARDGGSLGEVASLCRAEGAEAEVVVLDIARDGAADELAATAVERFGRIDVWVDLAAVLVAGDLADSEPAELRRLVDVNVTGPLLASRAALRTFERQGHGTLINVASMLALIPNPLVPAYVMSKYAVRGLSLALRLAVADRPGIDVCVVLPGPVDTPMFAHAANRTGRRLRAIPPAYAPERLAATIVSCARRPRRQTTAGALSQAMRVSHRLAPRTTEWAMGRYSAVSLLRREEEPPGAGTLFDPPPTGDVHGGWRRGRARCAAGEGWGRWLAGRGRAA